MAMAGTCDIFCRVLDNFGDVGVCWRLATQIAARGYGVRLWIDDPSALEWLAPAGASGVLVRPGLTPPASYVPAELVIEAFGMGLPAVVVAALQRASTGAQRPPLWINLEYLSAQPYASRSNGLRSPVAGAPALRRYFFFPGFTPQTAGLLREPELALRQAAFDAPAWLAGLGLAATQETRVSLFCYEPPVLADWLLHLAQAGLPALRAAGPSATTPAAGPVRLLITAGRAAQAVRAARGRLPASWNARGLLRMSFLPLLAQADFDHLLWAADINFVRGEDTLVRALWAGRPLIWQAYPQDDGAQAGKIAAFLDYLAAPERLRQYYNWWNSGAVVAGSDNMAAVPAADWSAWARLMQTRRQALAAQDDLLTRLLRWLAENR